ncbi:hypothetical protein D3C73_1236290 [compost metagenome]
MSSIILTSKSGKESISITWVWMFLGISITIGPGLPSLASLKASGIIENSSSIDLIRKLCLVIGIVKP